MPSTRFLIRFTRYLIPVLLLLMSAAVGWGKINTSSIIAYITSERRVPDAEVVVLELASGLSYSVARDDSVYEYYDVAWSPDAQMLAYGVNHPDHCLFLDIRTTFGTAISRVESDGGEYSCGIISSPQWLDSNTIVFISASSDDFITHIYRGNLDGSVRELLLEGTTMIRYAHLALSPDKTQLAFECIEASARSSICVMNIDGSNPHILIARAQEPDWSPDGRQIVFMRNQGTITDLYIYNLLSGEINQLTNDGGAHMPSWSLDGQQILFSSNPDENPELYLINIDGTGLQRITYTPHTAETYPVWMP